MLSAAHAARPPRGRERVLRLNTGSLESTTESLNEKRTAFALVGLLVLGVAGSVLWRRVNRMPVPFERDISEQHQYLSGLKVGMVYTLQKDVFYRVYEGDASLHPPHTLRCDFGIDEFRRGQVTNRYVRDTLPMGTRIRFRRAVVDELITHNVILHFAEVLDGKHHGQEVLINDLVDVPMTWLGEATPKEKPVGTGPAPD